MPRGTGERLLPKAAGLRRLPNHQEGVAAGVPRGLRRRPVLRAAAQQAAEILVRVHGRLLLRGGGGEGGQVRLCAVRLLTPPRAAPEPRFPAEISEIYCKIQNRLIFIMRNKDFFFFLHLEEKKKMLELQLPRHWRSMKDDIPGGIRTTVVTAATRVHLS